MKSKTKKEIENYIEQNFDVPVTIARDIADDIEKIIDVQEELDQYYAVNILENEIESSICPFCGEEFSCFAGITVNGVQYCSFDCYISDSVQKEVTKQFKNFLTNIYPTYEDIE